MSGKNAGWEQEAFEPERERRFRRAWDHSPLPADEKARLLETAQYMVGQLSGDDLGPPPAHWTTDQTAAWKAIMASEEARTAMLAWALKAWQKFWRRENIT